MRANNIDTEMIIVDDNSPDGTATLAQKQASVYPIKIIVRKEKKGLGSAIIDGINAAQSPVVCVMDADLSHPPEALPEMFKLIQSGNAELVIGSRRVKGGGTSEWIWYRKVIHWIAAFMGSFLTSVKDLTSGFFMFEKKIIDDIKLEPKSWKIGLEIIVKGRYDKYLECPITFVEREAGKSKMGSKEVVAYLMHLLSLTIYKISHRKNR